MNPVSALPELSFFVDAETGKLKINGLSELTPEDAKKAVEYARDHKAEVIAELSRKKMAKTCYTCHGKSFWRLNPDKSKWICASCHPPGAELDVIYLNKSEK